MNQTRLREIIDRLALTAESFGRCIVQVVHEDGTALTFRNALGWLYGEWLLVASEHNDYHYFHTGDLVTWGMYREERIPRLPLPAEDPPCPPTPRS